MALVCLVWGKEFADFFARYCVGSLLEPDNIPRISREHEVTLLLYTDRSTRAFLDRYDSFNTLSRYVRVELLPLEQLSAAGRTNHWIPWQHAVAGRSGDFDLFLVVIPDCVYAAGCLGTIINALKEHDTVYYTLPQVCRETVAAELDGLRRVDAHEYISFSSLQAVEIFLRHINPKHAVAACSGAFFVSHPEYMIELSPKSMVVSETGSHPFAIRSSTRSVSYTFDALSPGAKTCYLDILGISAEPALKYVEQYYRWPKLHRDHSWVMTLGSWAWNFRDASSATYSRSAIHIALDQGRVLEQHRRQLKRARTRFINATLDYLAVATRVYQCARVFSDATAAKYVALAIAAPGFHRHLRRLQSGLTVVLPKTGSRFEEVVERIEGRPAAREMLRRFLSLHVVASRLQIVPGHAVFLTYPDAADDFSRAFVVDPHTVALGPGLWGKALSPHLWVWENAFCIQADIDYGHLTWSMLDPVKGTSERVLDHPRSRFGVAKVRKLTATLALGRNFRRGPPGRLWLRLEDAARNSVILRFARRKAPRIYAFVVKVYHDLRRRSLGAPQIPVTVQLPPNEGMHDTYAAISKLNIVDNVAKVTRAFYERLDMPPRQSPVYSSLASIRSKLAKEVETFSANSTGSSLERFEFAWHAYQAGKIQEALQLFQVVIADEHLVRASAVDPRAREAVIRAAEICGRHAELVGDTGAAARLYRQILELGGSGIVARRLLLMLWREAKIREAADLAPSIMQSDRSLAQHLRGSDVVDDLTRELKREISQESTTARGQNARDIGLQVG